MAEGRAVVLDARILRGGCEGVEVYGAALHVRSEGTDAPVPPVLAAGVWGFAVTATDLACVRVAAVCDEITLPGVSAVVSVLEGTMPEPECSGPRCEAGSCRTPDRDGDGVGRCVAGEAPGRCDCDDADPDVRPGAADPCGDRLDQDCDGFDDECDVDCDGHPAGHAGVVDGRDCDDMDADVHPNQDVRLVWGIADGDRLARGCEAMPSSAPALDLCDGLDASGDGVDQDCNGLIDDGEDCRDTEDRDRDGVRACRMGTTGDCDPNDCDSGIAPGRAEICGNHIDEDADGVVEPCDSDDRDGDGQRASAAGGTDCDDGDPHTYLGAPDDCRTARAESCGVPVGCDEHGGDGDGDGYVARPTTGLGDCDDTRAEVRPFAPEDPCNARDDDCDGRVDEVLRDPRGRPGAYDGCVQRGGVATAVSYYETARHSEHCGGCGVTTTDAQDCCGGVPTNVNTPTECGACGHDCGPNTVCRAEGRDTNGSVYRCQCASDGDASWGDCNGSLVMGALDGCETRLDSDEAHCGSCDVRCGANEDCTRGACTCRPGYLDCDGLPGCEVNGATSLTNCGRCGNACAFANATGTCSMSVCELRMCTRGFGDCDAREETGCETSLNTQSNCGACGINCAARVLNVTTRMCTVGVCGYTFCNSGFQDCDDDRSNGCESAFTSVAHCGACGNACGLGESCNAAGDCTCGVLSATTGPACAPGHRCLGGFCTAI